MLKLTAIKIPLLKINNSRLDIGENLSLMAKLPLDSGDALTLLIHHPLQIRKSKIIRAFSRCIGRTGFLVVEEEGTLLVVATTVVAPHSIGDQKLQSPQEDDGFFQVNDAAVVLDGLDAL